MSDVQDETPSSWTVDTLRVFLSGKLSDLHEMLQERYSQQTKAVDAAFSSQQIAMQVAKTEQATAMNTALAVQKEAVQTAMAAADKATAKAEAAADKRFESVNEFRQQLADQADTFASKNEVDTRMKALTDKFDYESDSLRSAGQVREKSISDLELRLTRRLDLSQGQEKGTDESRGNMRRDTSIMVSIGSLVLAVIAVATTIITVLSRAP